MRHLRYISIFAFALIIFCCGEVISAQTFVPTPVEISKDKVKIQGTVYYMHTVLQGQTLYSIGKVYGVSVDEIKARNANISTPLQAGAIIYIPILPPSSSEAAQPKLPEGIVATTARDSEELAEENIPPVKYKKYKVKWYETLYDVAERFKVSVDNLAELNSISKDAALARKQELLIPDKDYDKRKRTDKKEVVPFPSDKEASSTEATDNSSSSLMSATHPSYLYSYSSRSYIISIVLPFNVSHSTEEPNINQTDFYSGALIALNDLKKVRGYERYHLQVVDLNNYSSVQQMLRSGVLDDSELIIGPIVESDLAPISRYALDKRIPIVSPMDTRTVTLADNNPFFFLFPVLPETCLNHQLDDMATNIYNDTISFTVISEADTDVRNILSQFESRGIKTNTFSYGLLQGRGQDTFMRYTLDSLHLNKVYVASESEAFVSDVLRNLHLLKSVLYYNMEVYGEPKWKNFESIELEYLHLMKTHLSLPYYVDYESRDTKQFVQTYWEVFKVEPTPYSFQGYDIMVYFLSALQRYGRLFPVYIESYRVKLLQSDVHFVPISSQSGFENISTRDIQYLDNWDISQR